LNKDPALGATETKKRELVAQCHFLSSWAKKVYTRVLDTSTWVDGFILMTSNRRRWHIKTLGFGVPWPKPRGEGASVWTWRSLAERKQRKLVSSWRRFRQKTEVNGWVRLAGFVEPAFGPGKAAGEMPLRASPQHRIYPALCIRGMLSYTGYGL
jgi:hypothetical protein